MKRCFVGKQEKDGGAKKVYNMARGRKKDKTPTHGTVETTIRNQGRGALVPISVYHSCILPAFAVDMISNVISAIMLLSER